MTITNGLVGRYELKRSEVFLYKLLFRTPAGAAPKPWESFGVPAFVLTDDTITVGGNWDQYPPCLNVKEFSDCLCRTGELTGGVVFRDTNPDSTDSFGFDFDDYRYLGALEGEHIIAKFGDDGLSLLQVTYQESLEEALKIPGLLTMVFPQPSEADRIDLDKYSNTEVAKYYDRLGFTLELRSLAEHCLETTGALFFEEVGDEITKDLNQFEGFKPVASEFSQGKVVKLVLARRLENGRIQLVKLYPGNADDPRPLRGGLILVKDDRQTKPNSEADHRRLRRRKLLRAQNA